jgi:hypothetical protein
LALLLGGEFGLGTLEHVSRSRDVPKYAVRSGLLGVIVALVGTPVAAGVAGGQAALTVKAVVAALIGALFAACAVLVAVGIARSTVSNRLFRYSGGLVQMVHGEPEPRVARWADVKEFTVHYDQTDEEPPRLGGFLLTTSTGTSLPGLRAYPGRRELRALVAEAESALAPRLIPAMTQAYESGTAVSFGRSQLGEEGIKAIGWGADNPIPWSLVKSVHMTYIGDQDGEYVDEIIVGRKDGPAEKISVSGLPNGLFLPALLAHAAARQGVLVTGYHKTGGGIPRA